MSRVSLGYGKVTDSRTAAMLAEAQRLSKVAFQYSQGSYNGGVSASGSTHDGGGTVDIRTIPIGSRAKKLEVVKALRRVGFAAWLRPYVKGLWGEHIHAVAVQPGGKGSRGVLSPSAHRQVIAYYAGRDGLAGLRKDPHASMGVPPHTWEKYKQLRDRPLVSLAKMKKVPAQTKLVQKALRRSSPEIKVDGVWGPQTQSAWEKAKRKTGKVGLRMLVHLAPYGGFRAVA
jgi:hypothetical protein